MPGVHTEMHRRWTLVRFGRAQECGVLRATEVGGCSCTGTEADSDASDVVYSISGFYTQEMPYQVCHTSPLGNDHLVDVARPDRPCLDLVAYPKLL